MRGYGRTHPHAPPLQNIYAPVMVEYQFSFVCHAESFGRMAAPCYPMENQLHRNFPRRQDLLLGATVLHQITEQKC
jgi:hypothetical protein